MEFSVIIDQFKSVQVEAMKLIISLFLGGIVGWQREHTGHDAGIRTFSSICMGSCLFGIISYLMSDEGGDPGRIAAQVVSGIGFIGVGVIIHEGGSVKGLTTSGTLWSMAAIGLAVAYNLYAVACLATFLIFLTLFLSRTRFWRYISKHSANYKPRNSTIHVQITATQIPVGPSSIIHTLSSNSSLTPKMRKNLKSNPQASFFKQPFDKSSKKK